MENKIAISSLAAPLAQATGKSRKICEDFLKEFFRLTTETLEAGESIRIKGLGTFKLVDIESRVSVNVNSGERHAIPAYRKVSFTPAKEIAAIINAPFEEFDSFEMEDEIPEDIFFEKSFPSRTKNKISDENSLNQQILEEGSAEENSDDIITYEAYTETEKEKNKTKETDEISPFIRPTEEVYEADSPLEEEQNLNERLEGETPMADYYEDTPRKSRFGIGFLTGALSTLLICVVIFMLGCFFDWWPVNFGKFHPAPNSITIEQKELPAESETEDEPEISEPEVAAPVENPIYDTVTTTRYLTTIAREHYGNFNFWPYIYLENESILGHPDRITPGTKVKVPSLSKYGVNPSNKEDIQIAKQKAREIYARYR